MFCAALQVNGNEISTMDNGRARMLMHDAMIPREGRQGHGGRAGRSQDHGYGGKEGTPLALHLDKERRKMQKKGALYVCVTGPGPQQ